LLNSYYLWGMNVNMDIWVTQAALAHELGVSVQCVHNWIERKKIESKKIEGSRLVLVNRNTAPEVGEMKNRK
jgi:DNA-binding transcriptional regulator YiaG